MGHSIGLPVGRGPPDLTSLVTLHPSIVDSLLNVPTLLLAVAALHALGMEVVPIPGDYHADGSFSEYNPCCNLCFFLESFVDS
jgi:hypothetical protein